MQFLDTIENVRKHRDLKLVTIEARRKYLVSQNLLAIEMERAKTFMNKSVYLGLSILEISKIVKYEI